MLGTEETAKMIWQIVYLGTSNVNILLISNLLLGPCLSERDKEGFGGQTKGP